jgi:hypothetical protein
VARVEKVLDQILRGTADANIAFTRMQRVVETLGFQERFAGAITFSRKTAWKKY